MVYIDVNRSEHCRSPELTTLSQILGDTSVNLRHLGYLVALAKERNFHKAARACNVTQPTLSAALKLLEREFGAPLVNRSSQRFESFTEEGRHVLDVARRMLADAEMLRESIRRPGGRLTGHLRIGIIPTAEPLAGYITASFHAHEPNVTITLLSKTSREIERDVHEHALEAGISYTGTLLDQLHAQPLFEEEYVLIGATRLLGAGRSRISWREAADFPLILLNKEMQNRRIIDQAFRSVGGSPRIMAESSTLVGVFSHVRQGKWCGIVPSTFTALVGPVDGIEVVDLTGSALRHEVGLVTLARTPRAPLAQALVDSLQGISGIAIRARAPT